MEKDLYLDEQTRTMSLATIKRLFRNAGAQRLYFKKLAANDNSKNQLYVGAGAEQTRPLPTGSWQKILGTSTKGGKEPSYILQAPLDWAWLRGDGTMVPAPNAKMIVYPQYGGEFRLSGFLDGAPQRPSTLFDPSKQGRQPGRVLFFGVVGAKVLAFVVPADAVAAAEIASEPQLEQIGVLTEIGLPEMRAGVATRAELLTALGDVHRRGWTTAKMRKSDGSTVPCRGNQAIGQTLLAELGVSADGRAQPDYYGWEVKGYTVKKFASVASKKITLMTPEPTGGFYGQHGAEAFLRRYGTAPAGRADVLYFEGAHRVGLRHRKRGTVLELAGYNSKTGKIDTGGGVRLHDKDGVLAAEWDFASLIEHWRKKHARAVFVPAEKSEDKQQFRYASKVHLGIGNPFHMLLESFQQGKVFYDPGIRLDPSSKSRLKPRNQFRILIPACLASIYEVPEKAVDVL